MSGGVDELRGVVSKRVEYIELLREAGALEPRDLVDELDHSRSTVTRALEELREAGLVERMEDGYEVTVAATMAAEEYRRHEARSRDILEASELLEPLSGATAPPPQLLADARTHLTDPLAPFRPLEAVSDRLRAADTVRAYLPTLVNPSLLRLWHRRTTSEGLDSTGLFDEGLLTKLQGQYPALLGEMSATDAFSAYTADGPPYALMLTTEDGTTTVTAVIYDADGGVRGVIVNDSPAAIEWAASRLNEIEADASPADDTLGASAELHDSSPAASTTWQPVGRDTGDEATGAADQALPVNLRTEGFVRLSADYFDAHDRAPPEVSWQTGFTVPEVRAGHAVDRLDETGRPLVDRLVEGLREEGGHVLLGPPGAGKSTTCMAVACEWFEHGFGPVLYRERGRGDEFTSASLLEAYLRQIDDHALVVVEDAVRREANEVFELLRVLGDRDDVTFLLDSRESEWRDSDDPTLDPRVSAARRTTLKEVSVPELDRDGYERFASHFSRLVGDEEQAKPGDGDAWGPIANGVGRGAGDDADPGTPLVAQAQLSRARMSASTRELAGPDALEADIAETYRSLENDAPDVVIDLAVLVNLLNAAGIPVAAEYLYALATDDQHAAVERAIAQLEGEVLFVRQDARGAGTEYRTRHEEWSRRFLEQLLELRPEAEARASFGRCATRLLALADSDDRRQKIRRHLGSSTPHLRRIEAGPTGWADEVTERLFTLGQSHSQLAPLYGLTGDGTIDLPDACSAFVEYKQAWWRADMNGYQGATERARSEIERLADVQADGTRLTTEEAERLQYLGQRGLAMYLRIGGNNDEAVRHATRALELADNLDDGYKIARAHELLIGLELRRSNLESARNHVEALQELADERDDPTVEALAIGNEAHFLLFQGAYSEVRRQLRWALDGDQDLHSDGTAAYALMQLSYVALAENDFELAEAALSSGQEIARDTGLSMGLSGLYARFSHLARKRGDVDSADAYLQRAAEHAADVPRLDGLRLRALALVEQARGNHETAVEAAGEATDAATEIDEPVLKTDTFQTLAQILIRRGDLSEAERFIEQSRETMEAADNRVKLATCDRLMAGLELERGNLDAAERFARDGLQTLAAADIDDEAADCRRVLGLVALRRGDASRAREEFEAGLELAEKSGVVRRVAQLHEGMGRVASEADEAGRARPHLEQAVETFEHLGDTARAREIRAQIAHSENTELS